MSTPSKIKLSNVSVDFEMLLEELKIDLRQKQTWKDLLLSGTGTTLLEYVAAIGTFNQYNIEVAFRESVLHLANRDSSVYGIAKTLGISVPRKTSAILSVSLTNNSNVNVTIPARSVFFTENNRLFNGADIIIPPNTTDIVTLNEGQYKSVTLNIVDANYQEYTIGEPDFVVTNDNIRVIVSDAALGTQELWRRTEEALWTLSSSDKVYYETTTPDGDVAIVFGDGTFGAQPNPNSTLTFEYAITSGSDANSVLTNASVFYGSNVSVSGTVIEYYRQGQNEKPPQYYKLYAPHIYRSRGRASSKSEYTSIILSNPDVADVTVTAQRDIFPNNPQWMNVVRVCVLPSGSNDTFGGINPNPQTTKWASFLDWLKPKTGWVELQSWNPTKVLVDIVVDVAMLQTASADDANTNITINIEALFAKNMYSLGKSVYISDISDACKLAGKVDYVVVKTPTSDAKPADNYTFLALGHLVLNLFYSERTSFSK